MGSTELLIMNWIERIANYSKETKFPTSLSIGEDGRVFGIWVMGQNYTVASTFYGGYPHGYLSRIKALFPDKKNVLHLFSGMVDLSIIPGDTVDINPMLNPTYVDDAQVMSKVPLQNYDLLLCDPQYSVEDSEHYGTPMVKRNLVMAQLGYRLKVGTHVVWLDQVLPMYRKDDFKVVGYIGMVKSTNHRFRVITIFEKI